MKVNNIRILCIQAPILLAAKGAARLAIDNQLRYDYELQNPNGVYRATKEEIFHPELRFKNAFNFKVPFRSLGKKKYIIRLLALASKCHSCRGDREDLTCFEVRELKSRISKRQKWLAKREIKYPDIAAKLTVDAALQAWWNG